MNTTDKKTITNNLKTLVAKREKMITEYYKMLNDPKYKRIIEMENNRQQNEKTIEEWDIMIAGKRAELNTLKTKLEQLKMKRNGNRGNPTVEVKLGPNGLIVNNPYQHQMTGATAPTGFIPNMGQMHVETGHRTYNPIRPSGQAQQSTNQPINPMMVSGFNTSTKPNIINPTIHPPMGSSGTSHGNFNGTPINPSFAPINPGVSGNVIVNSLINQSFGNGNGLVKPNIINPTICSSNTPMNPINPTGTPLNPINPPINPSINTSINSPINPTIINPSFSPSSQQIIPTNPISPTINPSFIQPSIHQRPVTLSLHRKPTLLEKALKTLETTFSSSYQFKHTESCTTVNLTKFDNYPYGDNVILIETVEGKMIGIFLGAYFVFIENDSLRYAVSKQGQPLPMFEPHECPDEFMVINNSFFLFSDYFQINNVGNDLDIPSGIDVTEWFTTQRGEVINVDIKQFHFIETLSIN